MNSSSNNNDDVELNARHHSNSNTAAVISATATHRKKVLLPTSNRTHKNNVGAAGAAGAVLTGMGPEVKARIFLFVACLWPLWILALFGASSAGRLQQQVTGSSSSQVVGPNSLMSGFLGSAGGGRLNLRTVLDRVDVMGYGPTHPRVAVVVVGDDSNQIQSTVESLYSNTDLNRIFLVCAVVEGQQEDPTLLKNLEKIDSGSTCYSSVSTMICSYYRCCSSSWY
jgi:hypothetical protein